MSSYAFFVQTYTSERKKQHSDDSVNFSEFSKKCSAQRGGRPCLGKKRENLKIGQRLTRLREK
ncbi:rCG37465 [Rattus norvegicus]|uniref:RCG37465 n=1 Tax=Rattus norvegicus TaxID=10116 RepID=A6KHQ7_RAT|nr:rCG37465 [Rattus norvegicus]